MGRTPIPKPGFLDDCHYLGFYTWDSLHGEIKVFNMRGRHMGVIDAVTGERIKPARKGRRIRV